MTKQQTTTPPETVYQVKVHTDEMIPLIYPGDTLEVHPEIEVKDGDTVIVYKSNGRGSSIGGIQFNDNNLRLIRSKPDTADLVFTSKQVKAIHKVEYVKIGPKRNYEGLK